MHGGDLPLHLRPQQIQPTAPMQSSPLGHLDAAAPSHGLTTPADRAMQETTEIKSSLGQRQLCHEMLDVTQEVNLVQPRGAGLKHSPTFFGCLDGGSAPSQASQAKPQGEGTLRSPRLNPDHRYGTPPRSPRTPRTDVKPGGGVPTAAVPERGQRHSRWKSEDIAKLEHELAQLRCASQALPDLCMRRDDGPSQSGTRTPRGEQDFKNASTGTPLEVAFLSHAAKATSSTQGAHGSRPQTPQRGMERAAQAWATISDSQSDVMTVRSGDSPPQHSEADTNATATQAQLREALLEIERLKRALQNAHHEIATLREEQKASEAAHSRDVAALAALLQSVTAEKAKSLGDAVKFSKIDKTGSTQSTDDSQLDSCSLNGSEPDSVGDIGNQITGLLRK